MQYRVLHDGLYDQLGDHTFFQSLLQLHDVRELIIETDLLDIYITVHQFQFFFQIDELSLGDTGPKDLRQSRRHGSDLRDMVGLRHPFHGIQCVIQEMRIQLCLHHGNMGSIEFLLLLHLILHALLQFVGHDIKVPGHLSQLVLSVGDDPDGKVSFLQCTHGRIHPFDRTGHISTQPGSHQNAQNDTDGQHHDQHTVHGVQYFCRKHAGTGQCSIQSTLSQRLDQQFSGTIYSQQLMTNHEFFPDLLFLQITIIINGSPEGVHDCYLRFGIPLIMKHFFKIFCAHADHNIAFRYTVFSHKFSRCIQ